MSNNSIEIPSLIQCEFLISKANVKVVTFEFCVEHKAFTIETSKLVFWKKEDYPLESSTAVIFRNCYHIEQGTTKWHLSAFQDLEGAVRHLIFLYHPPHYLDTEDVFLQECLKNKNIEHNELIKLKEHRYFEKPFNEKDVTWNLKKKD